MRYALAELLVDLGIMVLTTSHDKRTRMLKRIYPYVLFSKKRQAMCPIFGFVQFSFPAQLSMRGDLVKLCVITSLVLDRRGDKIRPSAFDQEFAS
jgi:hypothetical protein